MLLRTPILVCNLSTGLPMMCHILENDVTHHLEILDIWVEDDQAYRLAKLTENICQLQKTNKNGKWVEVRGRTADMAIARRITKLNTILKPDHAVVKTQHIVRKFTNSIIRIINRLSISNPCWICDKCGWREKHEAEVKCWKCGGTQGGEMIYSR